MHVLDGLLRVQLGLLSAAHAAVFYEAHVIRGHVAAGTWRRFFGRIYATDRCTLPDDVARAHAAVLLAYGRSVITGETALQLYGVRLSEEFGALTHLLIRTGTSVRRGPDLRIHKSSTFDFGSPQYVRSVPVVPLALAVVHAFRTLPRAVSKELVCVVVKQRRATPTDLRDAALGCAVFPGRTELLDWIDLVEDGCESPIEIDYVLYVERPFGLPRPTCRQRWIELPGRRIRADVAYDMARLLIELDGIGHSVDDVRRADLRRDAELGRLGWRVLRFTGRQIREEPQWVAQCVRDCLGVPATRAH
jgi:hypothetical protein